MELRQQQDGFSDVMLLIKYVFLMTFGTFYLFFLNLGHTMDTFINNCVSDQRSTSIFTGSTLSIMV